MRVRPRTFTALILALIISASCSQHVPPNLSPKAQVAWQATRVIHAIDVIRDVAQEGTKTVPPVISVDVATKVTQWHRSALLVIHNTPNGWAPIVDASLSQVFEQLSAPQKLQLGPYVQLARILLKEVTP